MISYEDDGKALKPCPFCGSDAIISEINKNDPFHSIVISCTNDECGASIERMTHTYSRTYDNPFGEYDVEKVNSCIEKVAMLWNREKR